MAGAYSSADIDRFRKASAERRLSTRDRKFINSFQMTPEEIITDEIDSIRPASVAALDAAISAAKTSDVRNTLLEEKNNALRLMQKYADQLLPKEEKKPPPAIDEIDMNAVMQFIQNIFK